MPYEHLDVAKRHPKIYSFLGKVINIFHEKFPILQIKLRIETSFAWKMGGKIFASISSMTALIYQKKEEKVK